MKRNILTIFLASPGDLQEERRIVRDTVDRVNKVLSRRVGWHIELLGWEDTLPGGSRPQALINKDVDSCQLFLGILWRRWGQETGKCSSGFEEEFLLAQERRHKTESPEMWLFFKEVDEDSAKDPGDQLKKVLAFKSELVKKKELMFKEFSETNNWGKIIYDNLLQYVLDLSLKESQIESQEESLLAGKARESHPVTKEKDKEKVESYPSELLGLFNKINILLNKGKATDLESSERIRLYLQSSAWFSSDHAGEVFGNHETNLVYKRRSDWELSNSEIWFLVRSFVSDKYDNRPGWYWIKNKSDDEIAFNFVWLATNDWNIDVRRGAWSLLVDIGFHAKRDLLEKGITDTDKQIILKTIKLIRNIENLEYLDLLDKAVESEEHDIKRAAMSAKIDLLYLSNPEQGFSYLVDSESNVTPLIQKTLDDMSLLCDSKLLFNALKKADASVRVFSARYLRKSKLLSKDIAYELLKDTDSFARKEGLLELIDLNEDIDMDFVKKIFPEQKKTKQGLGLFRQVQADDFLPIFLRKHDPENLLTQLDFFNIKSTEAYRILSEDHFPLMESRIRIDLDEAFDSFIKDSETRFRAKYGYEGGYKPDTTDFVRDRFIASAMDGLAKNGQREDIKYARKYLGHTKYNMADKGSINLLSKFGDSSDVDILIEAAKRNHGENRKTAVKTAYNLSKEKEALLKRLMFDKDNSIATIALQILLNHESGQKIEIAQDLLQAETDERRVNALAVFVSQYNSSELEKLLNDYISQESYYYNVVTWLDRCLYSKGEYLHFYKTKLSSKLE